MILGWSEELTLVEPYLKEPLFEEFCGDVVMGSSILSIAHINHVCAKLLDSMLISSVFPATILSYSHAFHESLCTIRGYYPSFDPYWAYLA